MNAEQLFASAVGHHRAGRLTEAAGEFQQVIALRPEWVDAWYGLGTVLALMGKNDQAIAAIERVLKLRPNYAEAMSDLGVLIFYFGRLDEAIELHRRALALRPDLPSAYNNLGMTLRDRGKPIEAVEALRRAVELAPRTFQAWANLANALRDCGQIDEAIGAARKALEINPGFPAALVALGVFYKDSGRLEEGLACLDRAIAADPNDLLAHDQKLYALHFHPGLDGPAILAEQKKWNDRFAPRVRKFIPQHVKNAPRDRLRIGYVSPDFRMHVVGRNILPLLRDHDRQRVDVFAYANHLRPADEMTERLRTYCDHWRQITGMNDQPVSEMIRKDGIDILVDLALHMPGNRLPLFGRKPAPIQVTFAGYPAGTGLETIDYRLTDPYLDPPEHDSHYAEKSIRLPHSFWCYDMEGMDLDTAGEIVELPALKADHITFGCLNNFCKVNEPVLNLWARVLREVPRSRLLLLGTGEYGRRTAEQFSRLGISADRIEFVINRSHNAYLALYRQVDIGLDSFPYNGHTTSLDSYWQGVPVVTLMGRTSVGRAGFSQLTNLGLSELVAKSPDEFVSIAITLARDLDRLRDLRSGMRERMRRSPLMDAKGFARGIEAAYQEMWKTL